MDASGSEEWRHTFGPSSAQIMLHDVRQTRDLGFVAAGQGYFSDSTGGTDAYLVKTDAAGNVMP